MQSSFWVLLEFVVSYVPENKNRTIVNHVSSPKNIVFIGFLFRRENINILFPTKEFQSENLHMVWMFSGSDLWCFYCSALSDIEILLQRKRLSDSFDLFVNFCEDSLISLFNITTN